jgi:hypothetical protein
VFSLNFNLLSHFDIVSLFVKRDLLLQEAIKQSTFLTNDFCPLQFLYHHEPARPNASRPKSTFGGGAAGETGPIVISSMCAFDQSIATAPR